MVIDEIDHLAVRRRQPGQTFLNDGIAILGVHHGLGIIGGIRDRRRHAIIETFVGATPKRRQRLVTGDREQPGRHLGFRFEALGLPPDIEEHLAYEVLGERDISRQTNDETVHPYVMARV